ncbi:MBL fold metallo-hydrolase [Sphingobacterium spiritivorum]|uniref:MBL fold metallo-hydrolase n=1 Tax=Sphingobacterium spiritivorum TaxID=258 RepID=UPI003DA31F5C
MFFERIYDESLAQASYMIGCQAKGVALVIDPKRDVDTYLEIAKRNNLKITQITETHIHADFLSGSRELAALTGATLYLSDEGGEDWQYEFPHEGLKEGDKLLVGNLTLTVIHTPGHTPESISFVLTDHPASDQPIMVFTGDFVFVGDVGRPDLLEKAAGITGTKEVGAKDMFRSIQKFLTLPDFVQLWPGHGAGSSCGKALGSVPSSTVGYERIRNWALQEKKEDKFVTELLDGQPEPPAYFAMMKKLNKVDRPLLLHVPEIPLLNKEQFLKYKQDDVTIVDTRPKELFVKGHIPQSINIQHKKSFATWGGWLLQYDKPFILVAAPHEIEELTRKLMRIGLDNVLGYITDIDDLGIPLEMTKVVDLAAVKSAINNPDIQLIDVRNTNEYQSGHIKGAISLMWGKLEKNLSAIDPQKTKLIYCQGGDRASIAASLLKKNGIEHVEIYLGSMNEWLSQGQEVEF